MKRSSTLVAAAAIFVGGMVGERVVSPAFSTPDASAATSAAVAPASSTLSVDALAEAAFAKASPAVVYVNNVGVGSGSGVIYDASGDIVTNAHVVEGAHALTVTLSTGKTLNAKLLGTDTMDDLAVIHVQASGLPAARFAAAGAFRVAQTVLAIGNPLDLQQSVTSGLISALNRTVQEANGAYLPDAVQTSAPINPGNSGGALVTLDGTVVGIPTLEAADPQNNNGGAAQGIGFAVPSYRVTTIAHQIITTGRVEHTGRAFLGVGAVDAARAAQAQSSFGFGGGSDTPTVSGALVQSVSSSSPAGKAGIQQGDVITKVNGKAIAGEDDLLTALAHAKPGASMTLTVNSNGTTHTLTVKLGELAAS